MPKALEPYDHITALLNRGDYALGAQSARAALEHAPNDARLWELLAAVDVAPLVAECCPCRLQGLRALFHAVGDAARRDACRARLSALAGGRSRDASQFPGDSW